jgi:hypothetical protein
MLAPGATVLVQTPNGPQAVPAFVAQRLAGAQVAPPQPYVPQPPPASNDQQVFEAYLRTKDNMTPELAARVAANVLGNPNGADPLYVGMLKQARAAHAAAGPDYDPRAAAEAEYQRQQAIAADFALQRSGKFGKELPAYAPGEKAHLAVENAALAKKWAAMQAAANPPDAVEPSLPLGQALLAQRGPR